jgi:hypothetical protein
MAAGPGKLSVAMLARPILEQRGIRFSLNGI